MEDFFPFLQNPADTDFISEPICHRRRAKATMGGPSSQLPFELSNEYIKRALPQRLSSQLPFELSNEYIKRALPQRLGPVVSQNCKFKRLDSHERLFVLPCY